MQILPSAGAAAIHLRPGVRAQMIEHARAVAPEECCGLLVGTGRLIDEAVRIRNVAATPRTRYLLDPGEHIATNRRLRGTGRSVVGAYHSHPRSPAMPSAVDRAEALYARFIWIVVSLARPAGNVAAYMIDADRVVPLTIVLES